jgi:hypothetical protein
MGGRMETVTDQPAGHAKPFKEKLNIPKG